jgi:hypothetical protein
MLRRALRPRASSRVECLTVRVIGKRKPQYDGHPYRGVTRVPKAAHQKEPYAGAKQVGRRCNKFDNGCQSVRHTLHASRNHAGRSDWSCDTGRIASARTIQIAATMVEAGSSCELPRHRSDGCHFEKPDMSRANWRPRVDNINRDPSSPGRLQEGAKRATSSFAIGNADSRSRNRWGGWTNLVEEE